jgi:maltooligosyltrehalose trehalohydrolase
VVFAQNHDQVGNRLGGERLSRLVSFEALKLAAGVTLLSPGLPLLFMGEEFGDTAPFLYFVSHGDPDLIEAVRRGRQEEFAAFGWPEAPPDPQAEETFMHCKIATNSAIRGVIRPCGNFTGPSCSCAGNWRTSPIWAGKTGKGRGLWRGKSSSRSGCGAKGEKPCCWPFSAGSLRRSPSPGRRGPGTKGWTPAEARWGGPGSTLPPEMGGGRDIRLTCPPHTLAVYLRRE